MQIKSGDVWALASTSILLVRKDQTSEIRLHGFKMLQVNLASSLLVMILVINVMLIALD
jgi:hypothetical protein